jgi:hypothetical protein
LTGKPGIAWIDPILSPATDTEAVEETPAAVAARATDVDSARAAIGPNAQAIVTAMQTVAAFIWWLLGGKVFALTMPAVRTAKTSLHSSRFMFAS